MTASRSVALSDYQRATLVRQTEAYCDSMRDMYLAALAGRIGLHDHETAAIKAERCEWLGAESQAWGRLAQDLRNKATLRVSGAAIETPGASFSATPGVADPDAQPVGPQVDSGTSDSQDRSGGRP